MKQTVSELRAALVLIEAEGLGEVEVRILQYAGGIDEAYLVLPVAPGEPGAPVMLETGLDIRMKQSVTELRQTLEELESKGFGESEVHVMQYAGGDDEPCYVNPVKPSGAGEPVMLETRYVRSY